MSTSSRFSPMKGNGDDSQHTGAKRESVINANPNVSGGASGSKVSTGKKKGMKY